MMQLAAVIECEEDESFIPVTDGTDIAALIDLLHRRVWLADLGWLEISASSGLLERFGVDVAVKNPEGIVYVVDPDLGRGLELDDKRVAHVRKAKTCYWT